MSKDRDRGNLKRSSFILLLSFLAILGIDQEKVFAQASVDSLLTPQSDPLLPPTSLNRELSALEKRRIKTAIIIINQEAEEKLAAGKIEDAFSLWFRELRLQRAIGVIEEVTDLGRIGAIAWQENRGLELRSIATRLTEIEQEANKTNKNNLELFNSLGNAYQKVRYLDKAVNIYQQLLSQARRQNNQIAAEKNLTILGELYLAKFDYLEAGIIYEDLLSSLNYDIKRLNSKELNNQEFYLLQLVEIYHSSQQPEKAILVKEKLIKQYLNQDKLEQIASLKISLAEDYQNTERIDLATQEYREAYTLANSLQQLALATDSLEKLANLYQEQEQLPLATTTYLELFNLEEKANNIYGLLEICDRLGKLYLLQNNYQEALNFYNQGLTFAQSLNQRVEYFQNQIDLVQQK